MYTHILLNIELHNMVAVVVQVMLRQYGPAVPQDVLRRLVEAFSELREMADNGLLAYPYSTREVVNIVKHLQVSINMKITCVVCVLGYVAVMFKLSYFCPLSGISRRRCGQCGEKCV